MAETSTEKKTPKKKKGKGKLAAFIIGFVAVAAITVALYLHYESIVVTASVGAALAVILVFAIIFRVFGAAHIGLGIFALGYAGYKIYDGLSSDSFVNVINCKSGYESVLGVVAGILYIVSGIIAIVAVTKAKKAKTAPQTSAPQSVALVPTQTGTTSPAIVSPSTPVVELDGKSYRLVDNKLIPVQEQPQEDKKQHPMDVAKGKEIQFKIGDGSDGSPIFITIKRD